MVSQSNREPLKEMKSHMEGSQRDNFAMMHVQNPSVFSNATSRSIMSYDNQIQGGAAHRS